MLITRLTRRLAVAFVALMMGAMATESNAQGITTGAISGIVTDSAGNALEGVQISVTNRTTGFSSRTISREGGRYLLQGLEVGGPYTVSARRIGFSPGERTNIEVALSQNLRVDFRLAQQAATLTAVEILSTPDVSASNTGTKTIVSDSVLQRLPNLNRNLADFARLAPQVSTAGAGYSAGGMSNRMNNVQIDGATERDVFGLGSTGQPGAEVGSKSVSIEAVKQLQILLAPFDVRQGNFGGLLLNAVSKSGTNELHGSAFFGYRDQNYGRDVPALRATDYQRKQYAFTLGGPIIRDRLNFFFAPEFQSETEPVSGPYIGSTDAANPLQIAQTDIDRYESIMRNKYKQDPGTGGQVEIPNPLRNFFGRMDYRVNDEHRAVFRYNYSYGERLRQQNSRAVNRLVYTDNFHTFTGIKHAPVLQIFSNFKGGSSNELFVGYNGYTHTRVPPTTFPQVTVTVPRVGGGNATIIGGADQSSQGNELDTHTYEITDNFTKPFGDHTITVGTRNELVKLRNLFAEGSYGVWTFTSLNNFENGVASSFRRAFLLKDEGNAYFDALQSALYAQDQWQARPNLSLTFGLRADISSFLRDVGYSAPIDSAYGRNTNDDVPTRAFQLSPRVAFSWDATNDQRNVIRGGVGMFVGTPPYVWLENAYINNGLIITNLNC
ncbi:MAG TPA: carboxypeptidase regulatory-like domain-containing protein, partial [Gemmatimonadaceae bacterium]|nr:carboxypeptidase regulatory-like domain-containing protein [Gemmatimonadaceae bacterium]